MKVSFKKILSQTTFNYHFLFILLLSCSEINFNQVFELYANLLVLGMNINPRNLHTERNLIY